MDKWISVKDKLPEQSGYYLCKLVDRDNYAVLQYSSTHKLFNAFDTTEYELALEFALAVTHWLPIPELPKGD